LLFRRKPLLESGTIFGHGNNRYSTKSRVLEGTVAGAEFLVEGWRPTSESVIPKASLPDHFEPRTMMPHFEDQDMARPRQAAFR
jgi:hypothetical protein